MIEQPSSKFYETVVLPGIPENTLRPGGYDLTRRALEFCEFSPGNRILDIGCGHGGTLHFLQGYGYQAIGFDLSFNILAGQKQNHNTFQADGLQIPLCSNSLDGIFLECALSVVKDPARVLSEVKRLLKPGGLFILSDIYARNTLFIQPLRSAVAHGCFNSIWSQDDVCKLVEGSCLQQLLWEDHSEALRTLMGNIIFNQGSMENFWSMFFQHKGKIGVNPLNFQLLLSRAKVGYFLLIAQKSVYP